MSASDKKKNLETVALRPVSGVHYFYFFLLFWFVFQQGDVIVPEVIYIQAWHSLPGTVSAAHRSVKRYPYLYYTAPARGPYHFLLLEQVFYCIWHRPRDLERNKKREESERFCQALGQRNA